jgi:hypothetical protein
MAPQQSKFLNKLKSTIEPRECVVLLVLYVILLRTILLFCKAKLKDVTTVILRLQFTLYLKEPVSAAFTHKFNSYFGLSQT